MRKSITLRAAVAIGRANLLLRQIVPGVVVECGATGNPIAVSANTAKAGELVPANTLADDIFALTANVSIAVGTKVQLAALGTVAPYVEGGGGILVGRAVSDARAALDIIYVAVDTATLIGGGGGTGGGGIPEAPADGQTYGRRGDIQDWVEIVPTPPGTAVPNGNVIGYAKGSSYVQLAASGTYIGRVWYFNGTPGANTGWI